MDLKRKGKKYEQTAKLVTTAVWESKQILDTLHRDNYLFESLMKIYGIFVQKTGDHDDNPNAEPVDVTVQLARKMPLTDIVHFMKYLKVCDDDDEFIDATANKLIILQEDDELVNEGISFQQLFQILIKVGFFQGFELTEKESLSVHSAQIIIDIVLQAEIFGQAASKSKLRHKIGCKVNDCNDIANNKGPFKDPKFYENTKMVIYKF